MNTGSNSASLLPQREPQLKNYAVIAFAVLIALIGALMMTVTSSAQMKGAAMLWVPAALQLMAGVWLGPVRGMVAGGLGAYAAGIIAYGGWGLVDVIMNPIAGGIANSLLPAVLFRLSKIDPSFGVTERNRLRAALVSFGLFVLILIVGALPVFTGLGKWAYLAACVLLVIALPIALGGTATRFGSLTLAALICVVCSAISALIGSFGVHLSGNTWEAALLGTGIGWFLGDTVSCFLGLYLLAYYTPAAREMGIAD
jgi:hypothetical protein